jgi:hypothetical protein
LQLFPVRQTSANLTHRKFDDQAAQGFSEGCNIVSQYGSERLSDFYALQPQECLISLRFVMFQMGRDVETESPARRRSVQIRTAMS